MVGTIKRTLAGLLAFLSTTLLYAASSMLSGNLLADIERQFGAPARGRLESWQHVIDNSRDLAARAKLDAVNRFFNQLRFQSDDETWGRADYWATPIEMLSLGRGDCEDFSIAKFFTLRELGIPNSRLRIMYVKALKLNQAHMVLTYYETPDAEPLILDNLVSEIQPASARTDLMPMYSFNTESLWQAKERGRGERMGSSDGIPRWDDVLSRINKQFGTPER
jgi:predicted transglutaminase-like cysteine proteinase